MPNKRIQFIPAEDGSIPISEQHQDYCAQLLYMEYMRAHKLVEKHRGFATTRNLLDNNTVFTSIRPGRCVFVLEHCLTHTKQSQFDIHLFLYNTPLEYKSFFGSQAEQMKAPLMDIDWDKEIPFVVNAGERLQLGKAVKPSQKECEEFVKQHRDREHQTAGYFFVDFKAD